MDTHSGDTKMMRFFAFMGGLLSFLVFGLLALLFVGLPRACSDRPNPEDPIAQEDAARREARAEVDKAQAEQIGAAAWKKVGEDAAAVPIAVALPKLVDTLEASSPSASKVPVPGTPAAEAAAAAAAAEAEKQANGAKTEEGSSAPAETEVKPAEGGPE